MIHNVFVKYLFGNDGRIRYIAAMRHGFSLVELSIVLVILGLLTGGILAGQSLIRAAEIRAVSTDLQKYATAHYSFRDKYFAIPGDMNNAVRFWGAADGSTGETAACLTTNSQTLSDTKRTCNGDGNGRIDPTATSHETYRYWQHLANAGLIEGSYTGIANAVGGGEPGFNVPLSKLQRLSIGSGWWPAGDPSGMYDSSNTYIFAGYYGNIYTIQGPRDTSFAPPQARILRPEEIWNIDTKMDDSKPHTGKLRARKGFGCTINDTTTPEYALNVTDMVCNGVFAL